MITNFSDSAVSRLKGLEGKLTRLVKLDAAAAGWPNNIVKSLRVKVDRDGISVSYPDSLADEVEDLEYGTQDSSPRPVFRKFMSKHLEKLNAPLEDVLLSRLAQLEAN